MVKKDDYESYFLNNLYNDEKITEKLASFQNRLYNDILPGKGAIQNNKIVSGNKSEIIINNELNKKYGFPDGSYSLQLNFHVIPYYSEKIFLTNYDYEKPISVLEIMKDTKVFSKNAYFFIDDFLINDVKIVMHKNNSTIFIPITSSDSISNINKNRFDIFMESNSSNSTWTLLLSSKSDYYYSFLSRSVLFNGTKIYKSKLSELKEYTNKPTKNNCWTMYVTADSQCLDMMASTNVIMGKDNLGDYFEVPEEFKNFVYGCAQNMKCLIINEPECSGTGIYLNTSDTDPIFQIPFKKNPIPLRNIIVWKYDNVHKRKLHPLVIDATLTYPNIYDFGKMINNSDLYIEWIEPSMDISAYDTYIQDYIDCYGESFTEMIKEETANPKILEYKPIEGSRITSENYYKSEYMGDYRGWRLNEFIQILKDNPTRYDELFEILYQNCRQYITRTYTFKENIHIYNRSIMDNRMHCNNASELVMNFYEPHTFIKIYDWRIDKKPCNLYINGKLRKPTYVMKYGSTLFIYFPNDWIKNNETIQLDIEILSNNIDNGNVHLKKGESLEDGINFPRNISLGNLVFYSKLTNEYMDLDKIKVYFKVNIDKIKYIGIDMTDKVSSILKEIILYEKEDKLVIPTDYDYVVLDSNEIRNVEVTNKDFCKEIDPSNLLFGTDYIPYINKVLQIASADFYRIYKATINENYYSIYGKQTYIMKEFKGKPSTSRLRVFVNSLRLNPNEFTVSFTGYNSDAIIEFANDLPEGTLDIQYNSYDEDVIFNGKISELKKTNTDILYLSEYLNMPYSKLIYKIYIDGYRISDDSIITVGQSNLIKIKSDYYQFSNDSDVVIYCQHTDQDVYEFSKDSQFLDKVSVEDNNFAQYLDQKYV